MHLSIFLLLCARAFYAPYCKGEINFFQYMGFKTTVPSVNVGTAIEIVSSQLHETKDVKRI